MRIEKTSRARIDITECIFWSAKNFGRPAAFRYKTLIETAIMAIAEDPEPFGSYELSGRKDGTRAYHLKHSRQDADVGGIIVKEPRHLVIYQIREPKSIRIIRLLHDRMEQERHVPG